MSERTFTVVLIHRQQRLHTFEVDLNSASFISCRLNPKMPLRKDPTRFECNLICKLLAPCSEVTQLPWFINWFVKSVMTRVNF